MRKSKEKTLRQCYLESGK